MEGIQEKYVLAARRDGVDKGRKPVLAKQMGCLCCMSAYAVLMSRVRKQSCCTQMFMMSKCRGSG